MSLIYGERINGEDTMPKHGVESQFGLTPEQPINSVKELISVCRQDYIDNYLTNDQTYENIDWEALYITQLIQDKEHPQSADKAAMFISLRFLNWYLDPFRTLQPETSIAMSSYIPTGTDFHQHINDYFIKYLYNLRTNKDNPHSSVPVSMDWKKQDDYRNFDYKQGIYQPLGSITEKTLSTDLEVSRSFLFCQGHEVNICGVYYRFSAK